MLVGVEVLFRGIRRFRGRYGLCVIGVGIDFILVFKGGFDVSWIRGYLVLGFVFGYCFFIVLGG